MPGPFFVLWGTSKNTVHINWFGRPYPGIATGRPGILQCSSIRGLCDKDIGTFAAHLPGYGYRIVINKAAVAGLKLIKSVG